MWLNEYFIVCVRVIWYLFIPVFLFLRLSVRHFSFPIVLFLSYSLVFLFSAFHLFLPSCPLPFCTFSFVVFYSVLAC